MALEYRLGTIEDVSAIVSLIHDAIEEMEGHGIYQWDEIYPIADDFEADIISKNLYLLNGYEVRGYADWRKGRFDLMEKEL